MKALDWPPLWTALFVGLAWGLSRVDPFAFDPWRGFAAALLVYAILLAVWAAVTLHRAGTTVLPHRAPDRLVTWGPFRFTRNPIYVADLVIVAAAAIWFGSPLSTLLVPALGAVLSRRFIRGEEARLAARFPRDWAIYSESVGRWS